MPRSRPTPARVLSIVTPLLSLLALTGCSDVLTYAHRSHEQGMSLYKERAYSDAAGAFRNAIRQDPRDLRSHYWLGVCYDQTEQHQQAWAAYRTALDVMATTMGGQGEDEFRLQIIETRANSIAQYDKQETELNGAEQRAQSSRKGEDWFLVAKVYRIKGDPDKAIDAYRRAAGFDSGNFAIRKEFGLYLLDPLNQRQDAEYYLRAAYRINNSDQAVVNGLNRLGIPAELGKTPGRPGAQPLGSNASLTAAPAPRD